MGCAVTPHDGDGVVDAGSLGFVDAGDIAFDSVDQPPDPGDFFLGRGGVGAGPVIDAVDGGGQPFAGAQQIIEVCLQLGQERDVGAEVVAADAAVPDRAGSAAGFDVGRLGAGAVGDGDLPDGVAGALGFQQGVRVAPDPVAMPVEAERGDGVDGVAAAVFADAVVAAGHGIAAVIEQFGQDVDRHSGVGVPLGVRMPVGVGHHPGLVEFGPVAGAQGRQRGEPVAVASLQGGCADCLAPVGISDRRRQQFQFRDGRVGKTLPDPVLLGGDDRGGCLADRQRRRSLLALMLS